MPHIQKMVEAGIVTREEHDHGYIIRMTEETWLRMVTAVAHVDEAAKVPKNLNGHARYSKKDDYDD